MNKQIIRDSSYFGINFKSHHLNEIGVEIHL